MHKVILLCLLIGTNPEQQNLNGIPEGSRVYVVPSSWFEIEMVEALRTKEVPVEVVAARNAADFEIDADSDSDSGQRARQTAMVSIKNLHSGQIIYAQKITKWAALHGRRSVAEACAKAIKKNIVTLSPEEFGAFQASPRASDKVSAPSQPVTDTPVPPGTGVSGSTVIDPGTQGTSLGEIARQARANSKQKIQVEELQRTQSDLSPVLSSNQDTTPEPEPSKIAMFLSACSRHPWLTTLAVLATLWFWKSPRISIRIPLDRLFPRSRPGASGTNAHNWSRTKQFYSTQGASNDDAQLFAALGVQPGCTAEQLRAAYLNRVKQWHPDRLEGMAPELREIANREVSKINDAYTRLSQRSGQPVV